MAKGKKTFHILKNFQPLGFRSPWWVIGNYFKNGEAERWKSKTDEQRLKRKDR